jgi:hypothetical protein
MEAPAAVKGRLHQKGRGKGARGLLEKSAPVVAAGASTGRDDGVLGADLPMLDDSDVVIAEKTLMGHKTGRSSAGVSATLKKPSLLMNRVRV